jgi:hypothetical protein
MPEQLAMLWARCLGLVIVDVDVRELGLGVGDVFAVGALMIALSSLLRRAGLLGPVKFEILVVVAEDSFFAI